MKRAQALERGTKLERVLRAARVAEQKGHSASALEILSTPFTTDGVPDSVIYRRARNLFDLGRISDAELALTKIKRRLPSKQWLLELLLGQLSLARFDATRAEKHFRRAFRLHSHETTAAIFLADCLRRQEKFEEAAAILKRALSSEGDRDEVYLGLGIIARARGRYRQARGYLEKALAISRNYPEAKKVLKDIEQALLARKRS